MALTDPGGTPLTVAGSPRGRLRRGLQRIAIGLILYGIAGLLVAILGFGTLLWTASAVASFNDRLAGESEELGVTLRDTAQALGDASLSAASFGRTLDATPPSVRQAAIAVRNLRPRLEQLDAQASAIDILGARPLLGIGQLFGQMAADLAGLDTQLDRIADELGGNQASLASNARSLAALAGRLSAFADRVDAGLVTESVDDIRQIVALVLAILVIAMAVPAVAALGFGLWLRRELGPGRSVAQVIVVER